MIDITIITVIASFSRFISLQRFTCVISITYESKPTSLEVVVAFQNLSQKALCRASGLFQLLKLIATLINWLFDVSPATCFQSFQWASERFAVV